MRQSKQTQCVLERIEWMRGKWEKSGLERREQGKSVRPHMP